MTEPLEPKAMGLLDLIADGKAPPGTMCADAYAMSIAISLKRIADALNASKGDSIADWVAAGVVDRRGH